MVSFAALAACVIVALTFIGICAVVALIGPAFLDKHLFPDANQVKLTNKPAKHRAAGQVLRILCFGDSLTEGFTDGGNAFHPYARRLGDLIYPQLPQGWHLEIEEQGESGERVLNGMKHRLQRTLDEHTQADRLYNWVVLLGGINDLAGDQTNAEDIMEGLDHLVQACLQHGADVMLATLLEVAMPEERVEQQRVQLNKLIKAYVTERKWEQKTLATNSSSNSCTVEAAAALESSGISNMKAANGLQSGLRHKKPRVASFDLAAALPYESMQEEQRWDIWDDGVHLTVRGYDVMGELIHNALMPLIKQCLAGDQRHNGEISSGRVQGNKKAD